MKHLIKGQQSKVDPNELIKHNHSVSWNPVKHTRYIFIYYLLGHLGAAETGCEQNIDILYLLS